MCAGAASVFTHNTGIIEEEIAEVRAMIGQPLRIRQWNLEASVDTVRHYSWGLGDENPLFTDEEYGKNSPFGGMIAPPTFFYSIFAAGIAPGFPGLQSFYAGARWEIVRYARLGERIEATAKLTDLKDVQGRRAGRLLIQIGEVEYKTKDGELLARHEARTFRLPRKGVDSKSGISYEPRKPIWTNEDLNAFDTEILAQKRRGATPLYFEDVAIGDTLPSLLKGPLTMATLIAFYAGCLPGSNKAAEMAVRHRYRCLNSPELVPNNRSPLWQAERTPVGEGHHDSNVANVVGMPGVYDVGWSRVGWAQQLITDWIGDHGILKMLDTSILLPNVVGDIVRFTGKVIDKRIDSGQYLVDVELKGQRQDDELSCKGTSTVLLPVRSQRA
jgi:acyl dehydratase